MTTETEFPAKLAEIKLAMEREEWAKAIHELENIGPLPDKFLAVVFNILFYLYLSRNQHEKLIPLSDRFDPAKSKDAILALLLLRNKKLDYPIGLPKRWDVAAWEKAIETHALAGKLEPKELPLCIHFLSLLNRPRLLEMLHARAVEAGETLDSESIEIVLRCYLRNEWFEKGRRFLWGNNLNNIPFERFSFLIDRAEKGVTAIPESKDKFLTFLRYKFGSEFPAKIPSF
jgi:hypothetical protein